MTDTPETDAVWKGNDTIKQVMTSRRLERERDMYRQQADYLVERLEKTQERMINAERICNKIYIARNISLSEKCVLSALVEIDTVYRTKHDGN